MLAGIFAGAGGDFGGQQVHDGAVLVGGPGGAVASQEAGPGALLAAEANEPSKRPWREPLEADGHFREAAAELATTRSMMPLLHQRLADGGLPAIAGDG